MRPATSVLSPRRATGRANRRCQSPGDHRSGPVPSARRRSARVSDPAAAGTDRSPPVRSGPPDRPGDPVGQVVGTSGLVVQERIRTIEPQRHRGTEKSPRNPALSDDDLARGTSFRHQVEPTREGDRTRSRRESRGITPQPHRSAWGLFSSRLLSVPRCLCGSIRSPRAGAPDATPRPGDLRSRRRRGRRPSPNRRAGRPFVVRWQGRLPQRNRSGRGRRSARVSVPAAAGRTGDVSRRVLPPVRLLNIKHPPHPPSQSRTVAPRSGGMDNC